MASVISDSAPAPSARISTNPEPSSYYFKSWAIPGFKRDTSLSCVEDPTQTQFIHHKVPPEVLLGESSSRQRNASLTWATPNFSASSDPNYCRPSFSNHMDPQYNAEGCSYNSEEWKNIQAYGQYLGEAATNNFPLPPNGQTFPPPVPFHTIPPPDNTTPQTSLSSYVSPFDWISWRGFQFNNEFSHLAPVDTAQGRTYAQQSSNLANWVSDPANDPAFVQWQSLNQVPEPQPISDEARQNQEEGERNALSQILTVEQDPRMGANMVPQMGGPGWQSDPRVHGNQVQGPFAQYLLQEAPISAPSSHNVGVTNNGQQDWTQGSSATDNQDFQGVVSQDNHWRRTIFG